MSAPKHTPNLAAQQWAFLESTLPRPRRSKNGLKLEVPEHPGHVNYALLPAGYRIPENAHTLRLTGFLALTQGTQLRPLGDAVPGGAPANFRPILMRSLYGDNNRWWPTGPGIVPVESAPFAVNFPLDPEQWSNVYGKIATSTPTTLKGWRRVLQSPLRLGFTCGGNNHYGHGFQTTQGRLAIRIITYQFLLT